MIKGKLRIFLSIILVLCISTLTVAGAQNFDDIKVFYKNIKVFVDKTEVSLNDEPFIYKDRVYVPIRFFAQALNTEVFWNREDNIVSININKKPRSKEKPSDHTPIELEIN